METIGFIIVLGLLYYLKNRIDGLEKKLRQYENDRVYDMQNAQLSAERNLASEPKPASNLGASPQENISPRTDQDRHPNAADQEQVRANIIRAETPSPQRVSARISQKQPAKIAALSGQSDRVFDTQNVDPENKVAQAQINPAIESIYTNASASQEAKPSKISINFEEFFGRQLPIWAGGITLAIAGVLIAKYASDNGVLTPLVKIIFGFLFGGALIAGAEIAYRKEDWVADPRVRQALSGAGIATLYATLYMGHNIYDILGPFFAFVGMAAVTAGAMALSVRFGAPSAVLGLLGGLVTPALIDSSNPNIPMLTLYLALTIGGLSAVSRKQKWAWLGVGALLGGAGWSILLIATSAFDFATSLSIGALVILLAIGLPFVAFAGNKGSLMRLASSIVGAGQLAFLVASGGFESLQWAMFATILIAGQWLARDQKLAIVPTVSLGLSVILLTIWPDPSIINYAIVGIVLAIIHIVPLLYRLWGATGRLQRAAELSLICMSIFFISHYHYGYNGAFGDYLWAALALLGASVAAIGIAMGWRVSRDGDVGFTLLSGVAAALIFIAFYSIAPSWSLPIGLAIIAFGLLIFAHLAGDISNQTGDIYLEKVSVIFAISGIALLFGPYIDDEMSRLVGFSDAPLSMLSLLRWGGLAAIFIGFAVRLKEKNLCYVMQGIAMLLSYGFAAQFIPPILLPSVIAIAIIAMAYASRKFSWPILAPAIAVGAMLIMLWTMEVSLNWLAHAALSLIGEPMIGAIATMKDIYARLLGPAILMMGALLLLHNSLAKRVKIIAISMILVIFFVAIHSLYRMGFAQFVGADFTQYGLIQRLIWGALLIGLGGIIWLRHHSINGKVGTGTLVGTGALALVGAGTLHAVYYSLILHNPFWADQAVGSWPIVNLLIPAFALPIIGGWIIGKIAPDAILKYDRMVQIGLMIIITIFAYATLRQYFQGSILSTRGFEPIEDISRSILAIILAVGYLLWGIKSQQRIWRLASLILMLGAVGKVFFFDAAGLEGLLRIGSFIALGMSLIGIGWLYARQLRSAADVDKAETLEIKEYL